MVKVDDNAVYDAIRRVKDNRFTGGIYQYGLAEQGVGYIYDKNNQKLIPPDVRARVEQLRQEIIAGRFKEGSAIVADADKDRLVFRLADTPVTANPRS